MRKSIKMVAMILVSSLALISLYGKPTKLEADPPTIALYTPISPIEAIKLYSGRYGASEAQMLAISDCESDFNPHAIGDGGLAKNIFQYHKQTFDAFSKLMGEQLDYNSYADQAKLTAFVFANYPKLKSHWSCYKKIYGV